MKISILSSILALLLTVFSGSILAQNEIEFPLLGEMKTLSARDINTSRWSIGGETLDRDYADYHAYKAYLGPLGAKRIRLQGGWAKCEQVKGQYDFSWLDAIVDDALAQGVSPWIQTSYGNPIYEGGGDAALAGGIPTSGEALQAWDAWVSALVNHFKDRVNEWEVWNEPDISKKFTAQEFAAFHVRTCDLIKQAQPKARIIALGLAGLGRVEYVESILKILKSEGKLAYFDVLTFHGYSARPEASYAQVGKLIALVKSYRPDAELWQGENGAPSTEKGVAVGALTRESWSELTQAKYDLRRMMGDMSHGVDVTNVFQISDMHYASGDHMVGLNSKGLLKARPDNSIEGPKMAYAAFQHAATLFSGEIKQRDKAIINTSEENLSVFAFDKKGAAGQAVVLWFSGERPMDDYATERVVFTIEKTKLKNPVYVNLLDGKVYELPEAHFFKKGNKITFTDIPVADSPIVLADKSWVKLK